MSNVGSLYLFSLVSSLCLLFGLNFLIRKGNLVVAKILAVQFLILAYLVVAAYYLMPEVIVVTPYFYRTSAPLFYILPPLNFMFMWYLLHPRAKFKWIHLVFFLPFLLQLIENTPYYLSSKEVKIEEVKWMLAQGDYFAYNPRFLWFDPYYHVYAKLGMYFVFYIAMVYYYVQFRRDKQNEVLFQKGVFHFWIIGILLFRFCTIFYLWYLFIYTGSGKSSFITTDYLLIAEFVFHLFYLAINPKLLDVKILAENLRGPEKEEVVLTDEEEVRLKTLASKVDEYFKTTEVFLNSQLTAELLGSLTGHPHRLIGQAIKHTHGISFRDYLNNYRIAYIEEKLSDPAYLAKSSIETIAEASGFGSRQSFYTAFKKAKGCTPKEYFNSRIG
ncbi:helix-turn-helix domain-containing protein [Aquirufa sp. KTFRIE-69F]|uniref:Helix-turn-helix domain-containing protein n=1 Tax=Aquirufa originis TaxID=3096514 RepID=A0ABW6DDM0_9BACT